MAWLASVIEDRPLPPVDDPVLAQGLPPSPDTSVLAVDRDGAPVPELVVAVLPADRGHGVGRRLLDALAVRAARHGHDRLALNVHVLNPTARLYCRAGSVVAGGGRGPLGVAMVKQVRAARVAPHARRVPGAGS